MLYSNDLNNLIEQRVLPLQLRNSVTICGAYQRYVSPVDGVPAVGVEASGDEDQVGFEAQ